VGGNCGGLGMIEAAVDKIYDELPPTPSDPFGDRPVLVLYDENGGSLDCEDDEEEGADWLHDMVVNAEIVALKAREE